jgi:hypothetical protein
MRAFAGGPCAAVRGATPSAGLAIFLPTKAVLCSQRVGGTAPRPRGYGLYAFWPFSCPP